MLAALKWQGVPVVTAMALIALGASIATISRFQCAGRFRAAVGANLFIYTSLYLLFIGAICHAATSGSREGLDLLQSADLVISIAPMAIAVRLAFAVLMDGEDARVGE